MARGIGLFFGVNLSKNFRKPYLSKNIRDFWRNWHISLSNWLKDYLYIPLGGNRKGRIRYFANILIVMLIGGLWHGANWNFIIWGAYHGLLLILYQLFKQSFRFDLINIMLTFSLVSIGWVIFRVDSFEQVVIYLDQIKAMSLGPFYLRFLKIIFSFGSVLFLIDLLQRKYVNDAFFMEFKYQSLAFGMTAGMLLISIIYIIIKKPYPFIYFQF
jgi:alginate O-acetyltransferase complex protein AlgI